MSTPEMHPALPQQPVPAEIAAFIRRQYEPSAAALDTAVLSLLDTLSTAMLSLGDPACAALIGPLVPGSTVPLGARLPGTNREGDPAATAADLTLCASWRGLHPAWLGVHLVYTSETLPPLLTVADWLCRNADRSGERRLLGARVPRTAGGVSMHELICAWIQAVEIQGQLARCLASSGQRGEAVRLATGAAAAVGAHLLGGDDGAVLAALALGLASGPARTPSRAGAPLAAADAAACAVTSAARAIAGWRTDEPLPPLRLTDPLGSGIMEQTLFNIALPDPLSAQTALEAAVRLHTQVRDRFAEVERIDVATHEAALEPADGEEEGVGLLTRAVAIGLLHGRAEEAHFASEARQDARLPALRERVQVRADVRLTEEYRDPDRQALPAAVQVLFRDGSRTERALVEYPLGHYKRRTECVPLLFGKAECSLRARFEDAQADDIVDQFDRPAELLALPADRFVDQWIGQGALGA